MGALGYHHGSLKRPQADAALQHWTEATGIDGLGHVEIQIYFPYPRGTVEILQSCALEILGRWQPLAQRDDVTTSVYTNTAT